MTRHEMVRTLPPELATVFNTMPENASRMVVTAICANSGLTMERTRQHLATLCAMGLVACDGEWCNRTQERTRRA